MKTYTNKLMKNRSVRFMVAVGILALFAMAAGAPAPFMP